LQCFTPDDCDMLPTPDGHQISPDWQRAAK